MTYTDRCVSRATTDLEYARFCANDAYSVIKALNVQGKITGNSDYLLVQGLVSAAVKILNDAYAEMVRPGYRIQPKKEKQVETEKDDIADADIKGIEKDTPPSPYCPYGKDFGFCGKCSPNGACTMTALTSYPPQYNMCPFFGAGFLPREKGR